MPKEDLKRVLLFARLDLLYCIDTGIATSASRYEQYVQQYPSCHSQIQQEGERIKTFLLDLKNKAPQSP